MLPPPDTTAAPWTVVLPVKGGPTAKTRLASGLSAGLRSRLATALARDCLTAVLGARHVGRAVVVTADPGVHAWARRDGAEVVGQPSDAPGLGGAVRVGLASAGPGPAAVLLADLPCLRPTDLDAALDAVARTCADPGAWGYVPDADGTGTVLIAATRTACLVPRFGPGSAAAHAGSGAVPLPVDLPRLRRDVDRPQDVLDALRLGVGVRTAATLAGVQATVLDFDAAGGSGSVVTDDGVRLVLAPDALTGSGLRHLRPGQRVTCRAAEDGRSVDLVRILGIEADPA